MSETVQNTEGNEIVQNATIADSIQDPIKKYRSQTALINEHWLAAKIRHMEQGMSSEQFNAELKEKYIAEAKAKYPRKGMYCIKEGSVISYLGEL